MARASRAVQAQNRYPTMGDGALEAQPDETEGTATYERSSAILLAFEPAKAEKTEVDDRGDWIDLRSHLEQRLTQMLAWRTSWWQHWALIAEYILPRRYHHLITANTMQRGNPINRNIVDPTGTKAMRVCASGLKEGLTSPSRPWFKVKIDSETIDLDDDAQKWLDHVTEVLQSTMAKSNFYDCATQLFEDNATFGTAPMIIYEDEQDVIRCYVPCAGEYFLGVSDAGRVESLYLLRTMTVLQIVQKFGLKNCPDEIQTLWRTKGGALDGERVVATAIEPNFAILNRQGESFQPMAAKQFAWREVYWVHGSSTEQPLSIRGFHSAPFISPRWSVTSNDPYGRSIAMDVLPDIMQLQLQQKRKAEAIEKVVRPPLLASADMKNQPSSTLPGHVTYVANLGAQTGMRPIYEVQPDLNHMSDDIEKLQKRIEDGFYNDLFLLMAQTTKEMTAAEVAERKQEKLQVVGPVINLFQNEGAGPLIRRIFSICKRRGKIRPAPDSLQGAPLTIEYTSLLTMAQKAAALTSIERLSGMAGNMAGVKPEVVDNIDEDELIRVYGDLLGVPHRIFRNRKDVEIMRQQRAAQQKQAADTQAAMQAGMAGAETAKLLADTPVGAGGNALDLMLGTGAGKAEI